VLADERDPGAPFVPSSLLADDRQPADARECDDERIGTVALGQLTHEAREGEYRHGDVTHSHPHSHTEGDEHDH
jgi:hypothetical protein